LNDPDKDNDACHDGLGGGLSPVASGNRIGIVRATNANLSVLGCIFEEAVKDIDAGDYAEDQVGGQHCPVNGDKFTAPCDCAKQAVQRNQHHIKWAGGIGKRDYVPEEGNDGKQEVHDNLNDYERLPHL
jgi:hypothetical protein